MEHINEKQLEHSSEMNGGCVRQQKLREGKGTLRMGCVQQVPAAPYITNGCAPDSLYNFLVK
jgi:hypothetical protein